MYRYPLYLPSAYQGPHGSLRVRAVLQARRRRRMLRRAALAALVGIAYLGVTFALVAMARWLALHWAA